ncbi:response regulator transcription factor [Nakamurella endophytica]|uniref:response regulator transcription factor n=1 Tax=Nakamurella endophytica TaxID=1748367 RepID=UPI001E2B303D|nr:response regulator transcription factor [Nakamurella endophytica]
MTGARVLLVEDDDTIRDAVARALAGEGFAVRALPDGRRFEQEVAAFRPDAAVLDIALPGPDGFRLARLLRQAGDVPVVFLTARDAVPDRLAGFAAGADDYVVKPFALAELVARVTVVLRRSGRLAASAVQVGDLVVDEQSATVVGEATELPLTATELRVLCFLVRHRGRTVSKTQILTQVWGYADYDPNLVEAYVSALRRKLGLRAGLISTVRGLGYRLSA